MMRESPTAFMQFEDGRVYVFIGIALVLAAMLLTRHLERSRYGMSLRAIKQDETAAEASGIDTLAWKLRAIALSGGMASMPSCSSWSRRYRSSACWSRLRR